MARKRMIDPDIWTDERVLELPWEAVPFYIGLISQADDEGRLKWSPKTLRARICFRENISVEDVGAWMWAIADIGLAEVYESENTLFAVLPGWKDYQKVQHPAASILPAPPDNLHESSRILVKARESSRTFVNPHESSPQVRSVRLDRLDISGSGASPRQPRPKINKSDLPHFGELEPDVVAYIANAASENSSGNITIGRELTLRRELESARSDLADRFAPALREANRRGAANVNYVRKVADSSLRRGLSAVPERELHGYLNGEKCAAIRGQEPNGWMTVPPRGKRMADLWPEHHSSAVDFESGVA